MKRRWHRCCFPVVNNKHYQNPQTAIHRSCLIKIGRWRGDLKSFIKVITSPSEVSHYEATGDVDLDLQYVNVFFLIYFS